MNSLECQIQEEWLRSLDFFSWEKTRLRGDLVTVQNFLKGISRGGGADLLSLLLNCRTKGNGINLSGKFRIGEGSSLRGWSGPGTGFTVVRATRPSEVKQHLSDALSLLPTFR